MKKVIIKTTTLAIILFITLFAFGSLRVAAQKKAAPEFSLYACGGVSTYWFHQLHLPTKGITSLGYNTKYGTEFHESTFKGIKSLGYSSDFGFGFSGFFSRQVGIHTGVGFGLLNVKSTLNLSNITLNQWDEDAELNYELHTKLTGYTEIHKTMFVTIPLMLQFQTKQKQHWNFNKTQKAGFYAMAGAKAHFLVSNKYATTVTTLSRAAYYPDYGTEYGSGWAGTQIHQGYGDFSGIDNSGKLDLGVLVLFTCELGVKWYIDKNLFVYTGAFFDCGLYDSTIKDKDNRQPYETFTSPEQLAELKLLKFSDKINLMVAGIKIRFAFSRRQTVY